jgi:hypothetical protein
VKKESGKVVETSEEGDVVKPHVTNEFPKVENSPQSPKKGAKKYNFEKFQNFVTWCLRRSL